MQVRVVAAVFTFDCITMYLYLTNVNARIVDYRDLGWLRRYKD